MVVDRTGFNANADLQGWCDWTSAEKGEWSVCRCSSAGYDDKKGQDSEAKEIYIFEQGGFHIFLFPKPGIESTTFIFATNNSSTSLHNVDNTILRLAMDYFCICYLTTGSAYTTSYFPHTRIESRLRLALPRTRTHVPQNRERNSNLIKRSTSHNLGNRPRSIRRGD